MKQVPTVMGCYATVPILNATLIPTVFNCHLGIKHNSRHNLHVAGGCKVWQIFDATT